MRISSAILLALPLAACGQGQSDASALARVEAEQRRSGDESGNIVCAHNGSPGFARTCTLDRADSKAGLVLTVRHVDGAFHRLLVTKDGRGVMAADGAEKAAVTVIGDGQIEVALGGDRYRLPATVKGQPPHP